MNMEYLVLAFERILKSYNVTYILTNNIDKTKYELIMKDLPNNIDSILISKSIDVTVRNQDNSTIHITEPLCQEDTICNVGIIKVILTRGTFCQKMSIIEEILRKELRK